MRTQIALLPALLITGSMSASDSPSRLSPTPLSSHIVTPIVTTSFGGIHGWIITNGGAPPKNAEITCIDICGVKRTAIANSSGEFKIGLLRAGECTVRITYPDSMKYPGYWILTVIRIEVRSNSWAIVKDILIQHSEQTAWAIWAPTVHYEYSCWNCFVITTKELEYLPI